MNTAAKAVVNPAQEITRGFILSKVKPRLLNASYETHEAITKPLYDLKVVYTVEIPQKGTLTLTDAMISALGIAPEELDHVAIDNLASDFIVQPIQSVISAMSGDQNASDADDGTGILYVVSNKTMTYGASVILSEKTQSHLHTMLGEKIVILPSSVHEVLAMPYGATWYSMEDLLHMVKDINSSEVRPEERLSDNVYLLTNHMIEAYK